MTKMFSKIESKMIHEGMRFSAPVFFDDGKNMFLSEGKAVKKYHLDALNKWKIPFLLTYGHELKNSNELNSNFINSPNNINNDVEQLETLEEL